MADVAPVLAVRAESIRRLIPASFTDRATGETRYRLRAEVLTSGGGFLLVTIPESLHDAHGLEVGKPAAFDVEARSWSMNGREGVAFVLRPTLSK